MNYQQLYHGLGGKIQQASYKGIARGTKKVQRNAKYLCPVNKGDLRNSIKTRNYAKKNEVGSQVYTNLEYNHVIEFGAGPKGRGTYPYKIIGYSPHYKANKWKVKIPKVGWRYISGQRAQPFMMPAFQHAKNTGEVQQEVIKSVQQDIRKLGGK